MQVTVNKTPENSVAQPEAAAAPQIDALKAIPPSVVVKDGTAVFIISDGRTISIRKMGPMDRMRMASIIGAENSKNELYLSNAVPAFCVIKIDSEAVPRPQNVLGLETLAERLGDKALLEITLAMAENFPEADLTQIVKDFQARQALKNL